MNSRSVVLTTGFLFATGLLFAQIPAPAFESPQTFGTASGYTTTMGYDLRGGAREYVVRKYHGASYCAVNSPSEGFAHVRLPDGAILSQLQFWAYDADPDWLTVSLHETCQAVGYDPPVTAQIGSADTFGAIGTYFGFMPLNGHRVNNRDCAYTLRVHFNPAGTCKFDQLQFQKAHISWIRDVSPAPATATFNDVATSHPFFQYIEALMKAGVTGGCGAGNFCPDAPLTRGQMAVFLSRAMGLQWP